jgi:hypothetical protein
MGQAALVIHPLLVLLKETTEDQVLATVTHPEVVVEQEQ